MHLTLGCFPTLAIFPSNITKLTSIIRPLSKIPWPVYCCHSSLSHTFSKILHTVMQYPFQSHTTFPLFLSFGATFQSHGFVYLLGSITSLESSFQITTQETQLHPARPHTHAHTSWWSDEPDWLVLFSLDSWDVYCYISTCPSPQKSPWCCFRLSHFFITSQICLPSNQLLRGEEAWKSKEPSKYIP